MLSSNQESTGLFLEKANSPARFEPLPPERRAAILLTQKRLKSKERNGDFNG